MASTSTTAGSRTGSPAALFILSLIVLVSHPTVAQPPRATGFRPSVNREKRVVNFGEGIAFQYPATWSPSGQKFSNAFELIAVGEKGSEIAPEARTLITAEQRLNRADTLERLQQIANSHEVKVTYLAIAGWPAFQRQYQEPLPEPAERAGRSGDTQLQDLRPEDRIALHSSTVIAAGDTILRLETVVAPKASKELAAQAEAWARAANLPARTDAEQTASELEKLRTQKPVPLPEPIGATPQTRRIWGRGLSTVSALVGGFSETEAGVSSNGSNLIVGSNAGFNISVNSGASFTPVGSSAALPFPNQGDPSIAVGKSGNFYIAQLGLPGAVSTVNTNGITGCSASVMGSGNHGQNFSFAGNAALCPATGTSMCFPDQEHIAADRTNPAAHGGDQLYAVWRNFTPITFLGIGFPLNCSGISGSNSAEISCSQDSGSNWTTPGVIGAGDFARISVAADGSVYAIMRDGTDVMVHKYSSCGSGLLGVPGFPRRVFSGINDPVCPLPGLDRCHPGLIVPTLAADDSNAAHLYAAVVRPGSGSSPNDDVIVADSNDRGLTWSVPVIVNSSVTARRFMPWLCSVAGNGYVGWYDRRAAALGATNDLTDYFLGSVTVRNGQLLPDGERNLSGASDPQCASGWPTAPDNTNDSEKCTLQPQLAGRCDNSSGTGSKIACDYTTGPACPAGESCTTATGAPKYGDYNGIACGGDVVLSTWASATTPAGVTGVTSTGIKVFADVEKVNRNLTIVLSTLPAGDPGKFNLKIDGATVATAVTNIAAGPFSQSVGSHSIEISSATGTNMADYGTSIAGDCDTDGTVHFSALHSPTCFITVVNQGLSQCTSACNSSGDCFNTRGKPSLHCIAGCVNRCSHPTLRVLNAIVPSTDPGRFNLHIDGGTKKSNAADGESTPAVSLTPGKHTVKETAGTATTLSSYKSRFSGDCDASGNVTLSYGQEAECLITNFRKLGTGADAHLTLKKLLVPASDPGRFNLTIDGVTVATGAGNGVSSPSTTVLAGTHTVGESGAAGTDPSLYTVRFSGACTAAGVVTLNVGDNKLCVITNTRRHQSQQCEQQCNAAEAECNADPHIGGNHRSCSRDRVQCGKACIP